MNRNSLGVVLSSGGLAAADSAAAAKPDTDSVAASRPDPEVVTQAKRHTHTAEYKQRILREAEAAAGREVALAIYSATKVCTCGWRIVLSPMISYSAMRHFGRSFIRYF
jgi:hypothetical protein